MSLGTLVRVDGRRYVIEDGSETANAEVAPDHDETRSRHRGHRHVSLMVLSFVPLAAVRHKAVRHKADALAAPRRTTRDEAGPWSAGRCRRSAALPAA
jgi:SRSO17 transposase